MLHTGLFKAFDENCDGQLDLAEMVRAVGWCCRSKTDRQDCESIHILSTVHIVHVYMYINYIYGQRFKIHYCCLM